MKNLNEIDGKILEIGNKDYKINLIEDLTHDSDDLGQCCYRKSYINIEAKLINTPEIMLEVVIHEIQHALNDRFMLNKLTDEEHFTDQLAVAWATILRRNRWLPDFIQLVSKG